MRIADHHGNIKPERALEACSQLGSGSIGIVWQQDSRAIAALDIGLIEDTEGTEFWVILRTLPLNPPSEYGKTASENSFVAQKHT